MFSPDSQDADKEGERGHNDFPGLGGAELPVAPEDFPHPTGQHVPVESGFQPTRRDSSTSETKTIFIHFCFLHVGFPINLKFEMFIENVSLLHSLK